MGRKADDDETVPLASFMHTGGPKSLHAMGEAKFWNELGVDPRPLAKFLFDHSGDWDACCDAIHDAHMRAHGLRWSNHKIFEEK